MRTTLKFMSVVVKAVPNGYGLSGFMLYSWPLCSCRPGNVYSPPPLPVDVFRQRVVLIVQNPNTEAFDSRSVRSRNRLKRKPKLFPCVQTSVQHPYPRNALLSKRKSDS